MVVAIIAFSVTWIVLQGFTLRPLGASSFIDGFIRTGRYRTFFFLAASLLLERYTLERFLVLLLLASFIYVSVRLPLFPDYKNTVSIVLESRYVYSRYSVYNLRRGGAGMGGGGVSCFIYLNRSYTYMEKNIFAFAFPL